MRKKKLKSGYQKGPSHEEGGIAGKVKGSNEPFEFEGGEFIFSKRAVEAIGKEKLAKANREKKLPLMAKKGGSVKKKNSAGSSIKTYSSGGYVDGK